MVYRKQNENYRNMFTNSLVQNASLNKCKYLHSETMSRRIRSSVVAAVSPRVADGTLEAAVVAVGRIRGGAGAY